MPPTLVVRSPTNANPVPVNGVTLANGQVSVYEGMNRLGGATADAQGSWSTTVALAEGGHLLKANATNGIVTSAFSQETSVIVDRTAPTVVARVPEPGATNVWTRDPITVTFSKTIDPNTLDASTVALDGGPSGLTVTPQLSGDGLVLTFGLAGLPAAPDHLVATLTSGIKDFAGNALVVPPGEWGWDVPEWQTLGVVGYGWVSTPWDLGGSVADSFSYDLAVDAAGHVYAAIIDQGGPEVPGFGTIDTPAYAGGGYGIGLDVDDAGRPAVAWSYGGVVTAAVWDGSAWVGKETLSTTTSAVGPKVLRTDGVVYVAWREGDAESYYPMVKIARWSGSSWTVISPSVFGAEELAQTLGTYSLVRNPSGGAMVVATRYGVVTWPPTGDYARDDWYVRGPPSGSLAPIPAGGNFVTFTPDVDSGYTVYVRNAPVTGEPPWFVATTSKLPAPLGWVAQGPGPAGQILLAGSGAPHSCDGSMSGTSTISVSEGTGPYDNISWAPLTAPLSITMPTATGGPEFAKVRTGPTGIVALTWAWVDCDRTGAHPRVSAARLNR